MKKNMLTWFVMAGMIVTLIGCGNTAKDTDGDVSQIAAEDNASGAKEDSEASTATPDENGNYIVNGSFEDVDFTGWTVNNVNDTTEELDIYSRETDCYDGIQCLHFYSTKDINFTVEQTVTGLEAGNYKLTGYVQGDTAGDDNSSVYFYAIVNGETIKADTSLNGYLTWNTTELKGLNVTDGEITIGVSVTNAPSGWGTIDAIALIKE